MAKIVIFGTGDIGELAHYYFTKDTGHDIVAFTIDKRYMEPGDHCGLPVVPFDDIINIYSPAEYKMFIALGYKRIDKVRAEKYMQAKQKGYQLVSYVSSKATVFDNVKIGDNCFILEDSTVQPFVEIGNNTTLWSGSHIGHHSIIGEHCFIAPHAAISGHVKIGDYSFIGVNATIRNGVVIAPECVIGAGSLIMKDTIEKGVYSSKATSLYMDNSSKLKAI